MSTASAFDAIILPALRDLGSFSVRRALPAPQRQRVGPFLFFDQFGPVILPPGHGVDVRPHPHIGLATLTWLFAGELQHRDSLGNDQVIRPGDVNWMTAGRGIVHSERSPASARSSAAPLGGTQVWLALPLGKEEREPAFHHYPASVIPRISDHGIALALVVGSAFGASSPVLTDSETLFADLQLDAGSRLPVPAHIEERAVYVVEGRLSLAGEQFSAGTLVVLRPGTDIVLLAESRCHALLLGGAGLAGERYLYWNFVASSRERLEQAKADWREGRFASVPGDDEFIPLPA